jgi:hypothetical protein
MLHVYESKDDDLSEFGKNERGAAVTHGVQINGAEDVSIEVSREVAH